MKRAIAASPPPPPLRCVGQIGFGVDIAKSAIVKTKSVAVHNKEMLANPQCIYGSIVRSGSSPLGIPTYAP